MRFLLLAIVSVLCVCVSSSNCPETNPPQSYLHLSTQTPYFPADCRQNYHAPPSALCVPTQYHLLSRHGVRFPSDDTIASFDELQAFFQQPNVSKIVAQSSFSYFRFLTNVFRSFYVGNMLTGNGQQQLLEMGNRIMENYKGFFVQSYAQFWTNKFFNPESYDLRSTYKTRTGQSLSALMYVLNKGLGTMDDGQFHPIHAKAPADSKTPDYMLRFFDACTKWAKEIDDNPQVLAMEDAWNAKIYPEIVKNVNERFGLNMYPQFMLTQDLVALLYKFCANYYAMYYDPQFCMIFTDQERDLIEYADDMEMYYEYGYGFNLSTQIAAPYLQNIFASISSEAESGTPPAQWGTIYMGHAETIAPVLAMMGLFKDDFVLTENIDAQQFAERKWRNEAMSGYQANIQTVLYKCPVSEKNSERKVGYKETENAGNEYYVKVMHNEKEVIIPGCADIYCEYNKLKSIWADALNINYDQVCENK